MHSILGLRNLLPCPAGSLSGLRLQTLPCPCSGAIEPLLPRRHSCSKHAKNLALHGSALTMTVSHLLRRFLMGFFPGRAIVVVPQGPNSRDLGHPALRGVVMFLLGLFAILGPAAATAQSTDGTGLVIYSVAGAGGLTGAVTARTRSSCSIRRSRQSRAAPAPFSTTAPPSPRRRGRSTSCRSSPFPRAVTT